MTSMVNPYTKWFAWSFFFMFSWWALRFDFLWDSMNMSSWGSFGRDRNMLRPHRTFVTKSYALDNLEHDFPISCVIWRKPSFEFIFFDLNFEVQILLSLNFVDAFKTSLLRCVENFSLIQVCLDWFCILERKFEPKHPCRLNRDQKPMDQNTHVTLVVSPFLRYEPLMSPSPFIAQTETRQD